MEAVLLNKKLELGTELKSSKIFLIVVPTPINPNMSPDTSYVLKAINQIIPILKKGNLIIIESTCPVYTTNKMYDHIVKKKPELKNKIYMAYCPERVIPGNIFDEFVQKVACFLTIQHRNLLEATEYSSVVKHKIAVEGGTVRRGRSFPFNRACHGWLRCKPQRSDTRKTDLLLFHEDFTDRFSN